MNNPRDIDQLRSHFADKKSPLYMEEIGVEYHDKISIKDITYDGFSQEKISTYLVEPSGEGPFPGVIYVHPSPGNRETFLEEAIKLAENGVASLVIEAPWAYDNFVAKLMQLFHGGLREWYTEIVIDLQRGIDLLTSLPDIDSERLGYVGHSFGALFGGIVAGLDNRIKTYILMAGVGSFTDVALHNMPDLAGDELKNFQEMMVPIDPIHYIGQAAPASLFFQLGRQDDFFTKKQFLDYYTAASEPKKMQWYDADHYMQNDDAFNDRINWLKGELNKNSGITDL